MINANGVPVLGGRGGSNERWVHPERAVEIDIDYDANGIVAITQDGLTALLRAAGWKRSN